MSNKITGFIIGFVLVVYVYQSFLLENARDQIQILQTANIYQQTQAGKIISALQTHIQQDQVSEKQAMDIVNSEYMPIDQCVVIKAPPCMNGHDELKGTDDDSACGI